MFGNKRKDSKKSQPPSLNKFMHPRNPYKNLPSFKELAVLYPEFRAHCSFDFKGKAFIDFKNSDALKSLTTCLLHKDFGLKVQIPEGRLVPTLPLRMNYLLWIEDLLSLFFQNLPESEKQPTVGVDIGTGAVCVYPLLGYKKFGWHFVATESDSINFNSAKANVTENELQENIFVIQSSDLFDVVKEEDVDTFIQHKKGVRNTAQAVVADDIESDSRQECGESYVIDFTVCNPPFFSSEVEIDTNHNSKKETRSQPHSVSTGSVQEKITEGGEIFFITKLIEKSIQYKNQIRIFTTLIGIKSHLKIVINLIKEKAKGIPISISQTEFCQGRTMRWGVAWSFCSKTSLEKVVSKKKQLTQKPFVLPVPRSLMTAYSVHTVWALIQTWLKEIKIKPQVIKLNKYYMFAIIKAYKPTWRRQRQKRRQEKNTNEDAILSNESLSETENSPNKRKPEEEEVEGNLLKRLKLQMSESNVEEMKESRSDKPSESTDSSSRIQTNELNESKSSCEMQESNEEADLNEQMECDLNTSGLSENISHGDEISDEDDYNISEEGISSEVISSEVHKTEEEASCFDESEADRSNEIYDKFPPAGSKQVTVTNRFPSAVKEESPLWKKSGSSVPYNEKGVKSGLECFLKCSMQIKHTEALISLELNFLTGVGKREAMHELLQYINNRLKQNK